MKIGLIGITGEILPHMMKKDIQVWGYTNDYDKTQEYYEKGDLTGCTTTLEYLSQVIHHDDKVHTSAGKIPAVFMINLPAENVDETINSLVEYCKHGDIIINHCNFNFKNYTKRSKALSKLGIQLVDCDTSNDSIVVSGSKVAMRVCSSIFRSLSPNSEWHEVAIWGTL